MLTEALTATSRKAILVAAGNGGVKKAVAGLPLSRSVVKRFVAGESVEAAVAAARGLVAQGLQVSLDHLGEDTLDADQAAKTTEAYLTLLARLSAEGLTSGGRTEVSVKLTAVGQAIDRQLAVDNARRICSAARNAGTTVTLDMEDHTTTDSTLDVLAELRHDFPDTGAVVQAYLHRTEADCKTLAVAGSRVRLCKGAYNEPASVAFQSTEEVDASYRRCLDVLMTGPGYPMVATHDPAMVGHAQSFGREKGTFEYQMLYGIRPLEQERLAASGQTVRVYTPYGSQWYGYLMRRLAERPANLLFFARALVSRS